MARPLREPVSLNLPTELGDAVLPRFATARLFQEVAYQYFGPHSAATIRKWNLSWRRVNGHDIAPTSEFIAEAERRLASALMLGCGKEPVATPIEART